MNYHRKKIIRHTCGRFSINPILLLAKVVQDQKVISHTMKSDEEFKSSIRSFANDLSRHHQEFDATDTKINTFTLEYSLQKVFHNDEWLIQDFLSICYIISQRYNILPKTGKKPFLDQHHTFKRDEETQIDLALPYAGTECWMLGATHFGALETEDSAIKNGVMSAIDMAPSLFQVIICIIKLS